MNHFHLFNLLAQNAGLDAGVQQATTLAGYVRTYGLILMGAAAVASAVMIGASGLNERWRHRGMMGLGSCIVGAILLVLAPSFVGS